MLENCTFVCVEKANEVPPTIGSGVNRSIRRYLGWGKVAREKVSFEPGVWGKASKSRSRVRESYRQLWTNDFVSMVFDWGA